jgi:hypothetical protein
VPGAHVEISYNEDLTPLEQALAHVRRAGDFFVQGSVEAPMPRVNVRGVGVLSFPVPDAQVEAVIGLSERAPYGRGAETVLDTSVRRVWQLPLSILDIGGKSWPRTFGQILAAAADGLGCAGEDVSAELYKLLVYDQGAFFKVHRDSEKAAGMFGTLLIVLPSPHAGGALVIRHAGREAAVDLSGGDVSELKFAAFYADCEHEVLPVTRGNRVCLVYNLLQRPSRKLEKRTPLLAPAYGAETAVAAELLGKALTGSGAPAKLVWLLEHQYSPAGLSFAALKNADKARAKVLSEAAARADCAIHLGIVHIEESGPAEYTGYGPYGPRGWGGDGGLGDEEGDTSSEDFEVVEVADGWSYIDQWRTLEDRDAGFGQLPLRDGEVLPTGALDNEAPDEQRLLEASGNEGVTFERAYHRAALVLWPRSRFVNVLLQAGVRAALPYLEARAASFGATASTDGERAALLAETRQVVEAWTQRVGGASDDGFHEADPGDELEDGDEDAEGDLGDVDDDADQGWDDDFDELVHGGPDTSAERSRMLALLRRLGEAELLELFVRAVVTARFDDADAAALAEAGEVLGVQRCVELLPRVIERNMRGAPRGCVNLFVRLTGAHRAPLAREWAGALREIATTVVDELPALNRPAASADRYRGGARTTSPIDGPTLAELFDELAALEAPELQAAACAAVLANGEAFDPRDVIVPALQALRGPRPAASADTEIRCLWLHAANALLASSEYPPEPPQDWRQEATLSCDCTDCRELRAFAAHPSDHTHRFRVRKDRRQHLHRQIDAHGLDMTHVTERKGSPQTLICTKTRRSYERRSKEYRRDVAALATLTELVADSPAELAAHCARIAAARRRAAAEPKADRTARGGRLRPHQQD